jgi:hypothetical protein
LPVEKLSRVFLGHLPCELHDSCARQVRKNKIKTVSANNDSSTSNLGKRNGSNKVRKGEIWSAFLP